ncbi:hypothetical protein [Croceicoccus ponticola]|uniref:hypothetical protein n=1 Tax=Croceicoccus ponticola TaxID=2217664 RepID=UPI001F0C5568|nr:hypothetical protein [Croceicoccus ponticola]
MIEQIRDQFGQRGASIALALLLEVALLLMLSTLGASIAGHKEPAVSLTSIDFRANPDQSETTPETSEPNEKTVDQANRDAQPQPIPEPPRPPEEQATPSDAPPLLLTPREMAAADIAKIRPRPATPATQGRAMIGPVAPRSSSDSQLVDGSGPNGEPLYAASWYRKPLDIELRGYLSTASGPGWGMIACRTAPEFRVEDCVGVGEYPEHSNIMRSVLAAAWQFQVRPPQIGGRAMIGEWVRIRIDYGIRQN